MRDRTYWIDIGAMLMLGLIGGLGAAWLGLPLPFMLGSLTLSAAYTILVGRSGRVVRFPVRMRYVFVAVIGAMIGARFTPELLTLLPGMWPTFAALTVFVMIAQRLGYVIMRRLGGYDQVTATYAAMPGGLIEAITLGEAAGGDVRVLTVQHFARIIIVVVSVPMMFFFVEGVSVGSSAGQTISTGPWEWRDLALVAVVAPAGLWLGRALRLPAGVLLGALIITAVLHLTGLWELHSPPWLLKLAQLMVGVGLGAQFAGATGRLLVKGFLLGSLSVLLMLVLGAAMALMLTPLVPGGGFEWIFICFAPGGMTEMALIALSLDASPVIVTAHHLFRIIFTVFYIGWLGKRMAADAAAE